MYMQLKQASRHLPHYAYMYTCTMSSTYTYMYLHMYLYGVLHVQCWSYDRHDECAVVLKGAVLGNQQHQWENKRNHLVVSKLTAQCRKHTLLDNALYIRLIIHGYNYAKTCICTYTVFPRNLAAARFNLKSLHPVAKFRGRQDFEGGN